MDARSDIFSFGSVLYEMVTGQKAFQGDSKMSTLMAVLKQEPKPISQLVPAMPPRSGKDNQSLPAEGPQSPLSSHAGLESCIAGTRKKSQIPASWLQPPIHNRLLIEAQYGPSAS